MSRRRKRGRRGRGIDLISQLVSEYITGDNPAGHPDSACNVTNHQSIEVSLQKGLIKILMILVSYEANIAKICNIGHCGQTGHCGL